jgi:hypothetical protein
MSDPHRRNGLSPIPLVPMFRKLGAIKMGRLHLTALPCLKPSFEFGFNYVGLNSLEHRRRCGKSLDRHAPFIIL